MFPQGLLRILATTDLHMHLLGYDMRARAGGSGLAALADIIAARRSAHDVTTVLFDNGDFLQGTALADAEAARLATWSPHLMAQAFNLLGYDAVTLGNHEFDYGVEALSAFIGQLDAKVVSANVQPPEGAKVWTRAILLERTIACDNGATHRIRLGVTGFAPRSLITGKGLQITDFGAGARDVIPTLKDAGADLVVALCHAGLAACETPEAESANQLALIRDVDALVMGHTHDRFPDPTAALTGNIDHSAGTVAGKPAVMAAYHGKAVGEIDLVLQKRPKGWVISQHDVRLHTPDATLYPPSPAREALETLAAPAHRRIAAQLRQPVGQSGTRLHNHLATVFPDPVATLCAKVMRQAASEATGAPCTIAAVAPLQPAGNKGRHSLIDLPAGILTRQDVAGLAPFQDRLCVIKRSGRQIRARLERSAAYYAVIRSGEAPKMLINPDSAGYFCDGLFGLRYDIDLGQPPAFTLAGEPIAGRRGRIGAIASKGRTLEDDTEVTVATTSFRAGGGGGYPVVPEQDILWRSEGTLQSILCGAVADGAAQDVPREVVWRFRAPQGAAAVIGSVPEGYTPEEIGARAITRDPEQGGQLFLQF